MRPPFLVRWKGFSGILGTMHITWLLPFSSGKVYQIQLQILKAQKSTKLKTTILKEFHLLKQLRNGKYIQGGLKYNHRQRNRGGIYSLRTCSLKPHSLATLYYKFIWLSPFSNSQSAKLTKTKNDVGPWPRFEETLVVFDHFLGLRQAGRRWSAQAKRRSRDLIRFAGLWTQQRVLGFM